MIFRFPSLLALSLSLVFCPPIPAQDAQDPPVDNAVASEPSQVESVSISFSGGSLETYVQNLQESATLNVYVDEAAKDTRLPVIEFANVSPESAIQLLGEVRQNEIDVLNIDDIYYVKYRRPPFRAPQTSVDVLSVQNILNQFSAEDLLSSINIGMELLDTSLPTSHLKLHKETGLLFVKGSPEQLEVIYNIVKQLGNSTRVDANQQKLELQKKMMEQLSRPGRNQNGSRNNNSSRERQ